MASKKSSRATKKKTNTISFTATSNNPYVIAVDVGVEGAVAVYKDGKHHTHRASFGPSMKETFELFITLLFQSNAEAVIILESFTRHMKVARRHHQHYGAIMVAAEIQKIPVYFVSDNAARKTVLGKSPRNREEAKALVRNYYEDPTISQDEADTMLAIDWYLAHRI